MIIFEYDTPTAGTRVSFVLKDDEFSIPVKVKGNTADDGRFIAEQNADNLRGLRDVLTALIDRI